MMRTPDTDIDIRGEHLVGCWKGQPGVWTMVFQVDGRTYTQLLTDSGYGMPPAAGQLEPIGVDPHVLLEGQRAAGFLVLTAADMGR